MTSNSVDFTGTWYFPAPRSSNKQEVVVICTHCLKDLSSFCAQGSEEKSLRNQKLDSYGSLLLTSTLPKMTVSLMSLPCSSLKLEQSEDKQQIQITAKFLYWL